MSITRFLSLCLLPLALLVVCPSMGHAAEAEAEAPAEEENPLADAMGDMKSVLRKFKRAINKDEIPADAAELAQRGKAAAELSKQHLPAMLAQVEDKEAKTKAYLQQMDAVIAKFVELETAAAAEDVEKCAAILSEMRDLEKRGHEDFRPEEE